MRPAGSRDRLGSWWMAWQSGRGDADPSDAPCVVVCVHNAPEATRACVDSLILARSLPYQIILVDDASEPGCAAMLQAYANRHDFVRHLRLEQNLGYTAAANHGLANASGQFVVLLNSDTEVAPGWMQALIDCALSSPDIGLVGPLSNAASWQSVPHALNPDGSLARHPMPSGAALHRLCARLAELSPRLYPRVEVLNGFCLGIRRAVIDHIGLLDAEAFPVGFGEENDYCFRARDAGFELAVADNAYVAHRKSASFGHQRRTELSQRGDAMLRLRHGDARVAAAIRQCREAPGLAAARATARLALAIQHPQPIPLGLEQRILFVLPARAGGGGAHSVVQEVQAMRELGFDARITVPAPFLDSYIEAYPELGDLDRWLQPFANPSALCALAEGVAVIVATVFTSINIIDEAIPADSDALFAYYIQDYEPRFYEPGTPGRAQAEASYYWPRCGLRFAKTDWIRAQVESLHGVPVSKVRPSLEDSLYRLASAAPEAEPPTLVAMLRPSTPRRAPERTARVLARVRSAWTSPIRIRLFGCDIDELSPELAGLVEGMELLGPLRRDQVAEVLQSAQIFLDLSDYQAFGRTGLEAMACGCVPVLPIEGGCAEFASHDVNAMLVDTTSEDACVAVTLALLEDESRRARLRAAGLVTAATFDRRSAAISELEVMATALADQRGRMSEAKPHDRLNLTRLRFGDTHSLLRSAALAAADSFELQDTTPAELVDSQGPVLIALHQLMQRHDLDLLRTWFAKRGQPLVLQYGADTADLDALDAALCSVQGAALITLLRHAAVVLVAGRAVERRLHGLGAKVERLPDLLDLDGWAGAGRRPDDNEAIRVLWIDYTDNKVPGPAHIAMQTAAELLGSSVHFDRVRIGSERDSGPRLSDTLVRSAPHTPHELSAWLAAQPPWHAAFASISRGASGGGRSLMWQRHFAALGLCPIVELDAETAGLAGGSDALVVKPSASAWLATLLGLPARRAELAAIGDNAFHIHSTSRSSMAFRHRWQRALSCLGEG